MKKLLFLLLLTSSSVFAGEVTLSFTAPVRSESCVDAGPLVDLASYNIYELVATISDPLVTSLVVPNVKPGVHRYVATAVTATGVESKTSNASEKTVTEFVVTNIIVKTVSKIPGHFLLLGVGTVPLGTACDATQEINGHYAVPLDAVDWSDPARDAGLAPIPLVVVAQCG